MLSPRFKGERTSSMAAIPLTQEVFYPESDGKPMGETDVHVTELIDLLAALRQRYRDAADVFVGGDMFLYYVEGNPARCVCPDVFVTFGIPKTQKKRRSYFLWREGRPPSMIIEVTSEGSRREDQEKKDLYARLGVEEYFIDDPLDEYLEPPLQGYRLVRGRYEPIEPDDQGRLLSRVTGLLLHRDGQGLRLVDATTGRPLPRIEEMGQAAEEKDRALAEMEQALREAQEEIARLRGQSGG
jgi:Uma2 family endonuclease